MTIEPILSGGLKLVPGNERDWLILLGIARDGDHELPQRFAGLMDEDSMWEDIVMPELKSEFFRQRELVIRTVIMARGTDQEEVIIERKDADAWYGALNQARLALEEKFQVTQFDKGDLQGVESEERRSAYFRNEFYGAVQNVLLEYVMEV